MKIINIGLLGLGTVGSGLYKLLEENVGLIEEGLYEDLGYRCRPRLKKILVRDLNKYQDYPRELLTTSIDDVLQDESIDIVCELLGGDTFALDYMRAALNQGKHLVTANKKALYTSRNQLFDLAKSKGLSLRYEGAVAGALPIISMIREALAADEILELRAILNGSSNFILTKIHQGLAYEDALDLARKLGYLEADESLDLEGYDPMHKLAILIRLITGSFPEEEDLARQGIDGISKEEIEKARGQAKKIKLICRASKTGGYRIGPELVAREDPFYLVDGSLNALALTCKNAGEIFISGPGAGSRETASAVAGDILSIIRSEYND